jgi:hypothetical protein
MLLKPAEIRTNKDGLLRIAMLTAIVTIDASYVPVIERLMRYPAVLE